MFSTVGIESSDKNRGDPNTWTNACVYARRKLTATPIYHKQAGFVCPIPNKLKQQRTSLILQQKCW